MIGVALLAGTCTQRQSDTRVLERGIEEHNTRAFAAELAKGFTPDRENSGDGARVPLIRAAAAEGDFDIVRLQLDRRVKVDLRTSDGATALMYACLSGNTEVARLLLDRGADVNNMAGFSQAGSPLMAAAKVGSLDGVKLLAERGADVSKGLTHFSTLLFLAADGGISSNI